jgi:transposase-like protein
MPWQEVSTMQVRQEFVALAQHEGANIRSLCRRFGFSPPTAYKWLARARSGADLADRSHRPQRSPRQTDPSSAAAVLALRDTHPAWGARKLRARRLQQGRTDVPAASTIPAILRRHARIPADRADHRPVQRFERPAPNELWQMDFKGHLPLARGGACMR